MAVWNGGRLRGKGPMHSTHNVPFSRYNSSPSLTLLPILRIEFLDKYLHGILEERSTL